MEVLDGKEDTTAMIGARRQIRLDENRLLVEATLV